MATNRSTDSSRGARAKLSGLALDSEPAMPESRLAQHDHLVVSDDVGRLGQLLATQVGDPRMDLRRVQGRVEDFSFFSPRAADQHGTDTLCVVEGNGAGALGRLVVGMGMDGQETEWLRHPLTLPGGEALASSATNEEGSISMSVMKRLSGIVQAKTNKLLDKAEDPRESLDLSYQKQLESLQKVRRSVADVTTAKKRIELQATQLQQQADKLQQQAKAALTQGNEDLAREALGRRTALADQLTDHPVPA